ncbi:MAG: hypothetical protein V8R80_02000 [Eubacterium sp.]
MDDFLYILKLQLMDRLTPAQIDDQILLYQNYIEEQVASGKTLEQVMRKLGDPVKIADLIVEDYEKRAKAQKRQDEREKMKQMTAEEINAQIKNPEHGFHAEFKENEGWDVRLGKLKLNTWYGTLLILAIVLVVFILISELTK